MYRVPYTCLDSLASWLNSHPLVGCRTNPATRQNNVHDPLHSRSSPFRQAHWRLQFRVHKDVKIMTWNSGSLGEAPVTAGH